MKRVVELIGSFWLGVRYCVFPVGMRDTGMARVSPWMITGWGLLYGLVLCVVFGASWKLFGDIYFSEYSRLRIVPMAMVILVGSATGFKQLLGLAVTVDRLAGEGRSDGAVIPPVKLPGQLAIVLVILLKFSALLSLPYHTPWWPGDWRRYFNFLYPVMYYRVLILLGLWGKTGLLVAGATGPTHGATDDVDRAFRRKLTIKSLIGNLVLTFVMTTVYFSQWRNRAIGMLVSVVIFLLVYLVSMIFSWRGKGHDRYSMFAIAELSELFLLLGYLAIAKFL
ncbi:MAG: hypothetical protein WC975_14720 [Phycisphaerae bacterium]